MRFHFIEDRRADYPGTILCDVLAVSPAGERHQAVLHCAPLGETERHSGCVEQSFT